MPSRLRHFLRPWNIPEALAPGLRALNRVTKAHHRTTDHLVHYLGHHTVFYPHRFFPDGFGPYEIAKRFKDEIKTAQRCRPPIGRINPTLSHPQLAQSGVVFQEGSFLSTIDDTRLLPAASQQALFEMVSPKGWTTLKHKTALVLLPGMGEFHYRRRREAVALPLAQEHGIASVILEGPFYGQRKPEGQRASKLRQLTDLLVLGRATIEEARSLLCWLREECGADTVVVAGCSMGGLHAAMTGAMMPQPVGIVSHIAPPSAYHPFCHGPMLFSSVDKAKLAAEVNAQQDSSLVECMADYMSVTDISRFPTPVQPDATVVTVGNQDEYVPASAVDAWRRVCNRWQGAKLRLLDVGHVTGILVEREPYREAIIEVVQTLKASQQSEALSSEL